MNGKSFNSLPILDGRQLRKAGRGLKVPFRILAESDNRPVDLVCEQILRMLPGKRLVCSGRYAGQAVVIKFFLDPRRASRHCLREEKGARVLNEAEIMAPAVILKAMLAPVKLPVLVFQKIEMASDLERAWNGLDDDRQRNGLLGRLMAVIADQHAAGLKQNDLHLRNFLLTPGGIYTIDAGSVDTRHYGKRLAETISIKNVGLLLAQLYPRFDRCIYSAAKVYLKRRGWLSSEKFYDRLIKEIRRQRRKRIKAYLKKIYRESTAFGTKKSWRHFLVFDRRWENDPLLRSLSDLDDRINNSRLLKDGNTCTVALIKPGQKQWVVKRYNIKNAWHALKRCPRPSRAWKSWRNAHRLAITGIPTPKPIAFLEKRWGPFRSKAYFITEYVEGTNLYRLLHSDKAEKTDTRTVLENFFKILQLFADASLSHGDFKATNFLVAGEQIWVTDLDSMRQHRFRWLFRRACRKDWRRLLRNWGDLPEIEQMFRQKFKYLKV